MILLSLFHYKNLVELNLCLKKILTIFYQPHVIVFKRTSLTLYNALNVIPNLTVLIILIHEKVRHTILKKITLFVILITHYKIYNYIYIYKYLIIYYKIYFLIYFDNQIPRYLIFWSAIMKSFFNFSLIFIDLYRIAMDI